MAFRNHWTIPLLKMMQPGLIVDPVRQLHEHPSSGRGGSAVPSGHEVEASVLAQVARGVLAHVTAMLGLWRKRTDHKGRALRAAPPDDRLTRPRGAGESGRQVRSHRLAECAQRFVADRPIRPRRRLTRAPRALSARMHRDEQHPGERPRSVTETRSDGAGNR